MSLLSAQLADLAARGQTTTYGELARALGLSGAGTIRQLTDALELLMVEDHAAGRPLSAVLCGNRHTGGQPGAGFFSTARDLGYRIDDPVAFVTSERAALFAVSREASQKRTDSL